MGEYGYFSFSYAINSNLILFCAVPHKHFPGIHVDQVHLIYIEIYSCWCAMNVSPIRVFAYLRCFQCFFRCHPRMRRPRGFAPGVAPMAVTLRFLGALRVSVGFSCKFAQNTSHSELLTCFLELSFQFCLAARNCNIYPTSKPGNFSMDVNASNPSSFIAVLQLQFTRFGYLRNRPFWVGSFLGVGLQLGNEPRSSE